VRACSPRNCENETGLITKDVAPMVTLEPIADNDEMNMADMVVHARSARDLLKALAHETRLMILCLLVEEERSVGELEQLMELRQPSVSQQLARLRFDGLVNARREGRTIYYSLGSDEAKQVVTLLYGLYCQPAK
jgi:DNA-binding transcriptional ArsR family regulator